MQKDHVLKKMNFDLPTPSPGSEFFGFFLGGGWGSAGKIFATMLLHFVIPFNLICKKTTF